VDKPLCRLCGQRHLGGCPSLLEPAAPKRVAAIPKAKLVKRRISKGHEYVEGFTPGTKVYALETKTIEYGTEPWPLPDKFMEVEPGTLSKPVMQPITNPKKPVDPVTKRDRVTRVHCPTCRCDAPRIHSSKAEKQKAYRERKKADGTTKS